MTTQRSMLIHNVAVITLHIIIVTISYAEADYANVYGNELQSCSHNGMALSGYTRTGYCVDEQDDSGSHHICIDLSSADGGNFCTVTGQSDWCSSYMQCDESNYYAQGDGNEGNEEDGDEYDTDDDGQQCPVQNWCVCQWAFANYLEAAGGCDAIQDVVCDSINAEAVKAYIQKKNAGSKYTDALDCIVSRCGVDLTLYENGEGFWRSMFINHFGQSSSSASRNGILVVLLGILGLAVFALQIFARKRVGSMEQPILNETKTPENSMANYNRAMT
mmetsp:Transcript_12993/g.15247  ORF Transcript_12993/g.15247 Transcript_12993/m.15247 type:complete len:275 (-) Transcript_12993:90-914(-)|eukprot:CAMPEP_0198266910 /NCGR_PEP_ID=MMETSP1447-20131203/30627_1 /TAXON_ID=420782 /ORGANISM="Chaetoceros dichaeta, Strain CCMP1751" /LENGTH=274 /DNA_ID=CAMNT_0043957221 /DNA_START=34 /DNA_END=858 /DNA_ORIENTATION=-